MFVGTVWTSDGPGEQCQAEVPQEPGVLGDLDGDRAGDPVRSHHVEQETGGHRVGRAQYQGPQPPRGTTQVHCITVNSF